MSNENSESKSLPYAVVLSDEERRRLRQLVGTPSEQLRTVRRASILLRLDGGQTAPDIAKTLNIVRATVYNCAARFKEGGLERALYDRARPGSPARIGKEARDWIAGLAQCSPRSVGLEAPQWSVTLLRTYIESHAAQCGFPELEHISRSRLWELMPPKNLVHAPEGAFRPSPNTVEINWTGISLKAFCDEDGVFRVVMPEDFPEKTPPEDTFVMPLIGAVSLKTGRLFFTAGSPERAEDFIGFLRYIDSVTPKNCMIELFSDNPDTALAPEVKLFLFKELGRYALVYRNRYGTLLSVMRHFVGSTCRTLLSPLRARSPEELRQMVLSTLNTYAVSH